MAGISITPEQLEEIRRRVAAGESQASISRALHVDRTTVRKYVGRSSARPGSPSPAQVPPKEGIERQGDANAEVVTCVSRTVRTLEDAMRVAEVDEAVWEVERYVVNKWDNVAKLDGNKLAATELWQVKVWLRRRVAKSVEDWTAATLARMKRWAPKYTKIQRPRQVSDPHLLEISPCDAHFAKLAWAVETGQNYDLRIASTLFDQSVRTLASKASGFNVARILLVLGNDFFHVDTLAKTTTGGTPQDTDGRFVKMFEAGEASAIRAVEYLLTIAPVDVLLVRGNHDWLTSWHLVHTLKAQFHRCADVAIDDGPAPRKYYPFGANLLCFTHGNEERHDSLPGIMASEARHLIGAARHVEWHLGHLHKQRETRYVAVDTFDGIPVRVLPSLSGRDDWHCKKGYIGTRAAEAYVYSRENGLSGYFRANVVGETKVA